MLSRDGSARYEKLMANRRLVALIAVFLLVLGAVVGFRYGIYITAQEQDSQLLALDGKQDADSASLTEIAVHIKGAIAAPGLYYFSSGQRVADAIEVAGGALPTADLEQINLAAYLTDASQLHVPERVEEDSASVDTANPAAEAEKNDYAAASSEKESATSKININTATAQQLQQLSGIGEVKAAAIVAYRESNGNFTDISQITRVSGIGNATYEKIKDYISVE